MANEQLQKLLQGGVKAAKAGNPDLARKAFLQALKIDKTSESAWLGLASVASDKKEQLQALKQVLTLNPQNERARASVEKMGITPERLLGVQTTSESPTEPPVPVMRPTPITPPSPVADVPDYLRDMGFPDEPIVEASDDIPTSLPAHEVDMPAETVDDVDDHTAFGFYDSVDDDPLSADSRDDSAEESTSQEEMLDAMLVNLEPIDLNALFSSYPIPTRGDGGVPVPDQASLQRAAEEADAQIQQYLAEIYDTGHFIWAQKTRGRAGERELSILQAQVGGVIAVFIVIIGLVVASVLTQRAEEERLLAQAPTWTISPTPTNTATSTPGTTPTPSPTSALSATPSPTIDPSITPGSLFATAEPTDFYVPIGVGREADVEEAARLIADGQLDEALPLLESARAGTTTTGNFLPYYYLSIWHLERNDLISALETIETGEIEWQDKSPNTNYTPLVNVAYARVLGEQVRVLQRDGATGDAIEERLEQMQTYAETALEADGRFIEATLLLAERYILAADYDEALRVLTEAKNSAVTGETFVDLRIREMTAQVYMAREEYDRALQEAYEILFIDPYNEAALNLQVDIALIQNEPGLAVIYAEQYLARYPASARAFLLRGQAWALEGKYDLALTQYAQALIAPDLNDAETQAILLAQAEIHTTLRQYDVALEDLTEALRLSDDDPTIRVQRMKTAYLAGRYSLAREDADELASVTLAPNIISAGELSLLQAQIEINQADASDTDVYERGLQLINDAIFVQGIPTELRPEADEYLARTQFQLGNLDEARDAIELALSAGETGSRYFLRGQILQALGEREDQTLLLDQALRDYETVLAWNAVFNYPFREELRAIHATLRERLRDTTSDS